MKQRKLITGYLFVLFSAFIFGLMPLMAKLIYREGTNPQSLVFLRNIISIPVLLLLSFVTKKPPRINPRALPHISLIALMGCCITPLLLFHSYNHIPSGTATVFHFIYPPVVVLGEYIFFKNKFSLSNLLSVLLCVIGIILFYNPNTTFNIKGSFYALVSGVTYAIYVMCLSEFKYKEISGFTFSLYIAICASVVMLLVCVLTNQLKVPQSAFGWFLTFLFSISLNVGAVVLFQKGTFLIGGGRASILSTIEPVTSILAGVVIFNEKMSAFTITGTILVITASILIALNGIKAQASYTD